MSILNSRAVRCLPMRLCFQEVPDVIVICKPKAGTWLPCFLGLPDLGSGLPTMSLSRVVLSILCRHECLGHPARCPFTVSFLGEGFPKKTKVGTHILSSLQEDLGVCSLECRICGMAKTPGAFSRLKADS